MPNTQDLNDFTWLYILIKYAYFSRRRIQQVNEKMYYYQIFTLSNRIECSIKKIMVEKKKTYAVVYPKIVVTIE